jgi:hypothetical protein
VAIVKLQAPQLDELGFAEQVRLRFCAGQLNNVCAQQAVYNTKAGSKAMGGDAQHRLW